ncbi:MAG: PHP domain-containing protein [Deltaproteobacteria bacterium]|nr:PHP domain-containing protein [Deltaproteobacteria bacterium]
MKRLDLHAHSTASDGTFSPRELVRLAQLAGLAGLALCDHDTMEGVAEFKKAGQELGFRVLGGVELSLKFSGVTHLLGLELPGSPERPLLLSGLQDLRAQRNERLFSRLIELGLDLQMSRIAEISGGGQIGRPHFAKAMIEKGYCHSIQEAFDMFLGKGQPAYVPKVRLSPQEGLRTLRDVGYAPVLAHPRSLKLPPKEWPEILPQWKKDGLVGLEAYHPDHSLEDIRFFVQLARRFDLAITAGSDFHGANKRVPITWVKRHSPVGVEVLARLKAKLNEEL